MISNEERNYYRDIHSIKKSLECIAKSLKEISENTKPVSYRRITKPLDTEPVSEEQKKFNEAIAEAILSGDGSRENPEL